MASNIGLANTRCLPVPFTKGTKFYYAYSLIVTSVSSFINLNCVAMIFTLSKGHLNVLEIKCYDHHALIVR